MKKNLGSILEALVIGGALTVGTATCGGGDQQATEEGGGEATQGGEMSCSANSCSGMMHGDSGNGGDDQAAGSTVPAEGDAEPGPAE